MTGIGLLEWGFRLEDVIRQTDDPDSPLVPGEKQCRFCPFAPQCPALRELATVTARQEFAPAIEYDPADLQKALDLAPVLRTWANAVEDFAKDEAKAGRVVPGWKLVESLGNRKWRDESVAGEAILAANEDLDIYNYKMKSPAQIEKLLGKEHKDLVAGLVTRESTGVTLVRDTDKRSTVSTDPTKEFEKING
jgi:hypothetical protein